MAGTQRTKYGAERYFLLLIALSFFGWLYETIFVLFQTGRIRHQGFLNSPVCPIYGTAIMAAYLLLGTPNEPRGLLKSVENKPARTVLYLLAAFFIPSVFELVVGLYFERRYSLMLWCYRGMPLNIYGVVCVPISLAWSLLLYGFMRWGFTPLKNAVQKIPLPAARIITVLFAALLIFDFYKNFSVL